ncbi:MAG: hypothetical protein ACK5LM_04715 [Lactovum sp.]
MIKQVKFYIRNNWPILSVAVATLMANIIILLYLSNLAEKFLEVEGGVYSLNISDFSYRFLSFVNIIVFLLIFFVFLENTFEIFRKARRFKSVFGNLSLIYYLFNPFLIFLALCIFKFTNSISSTSTGYYKFSDEFRVGDNEVYLALFLFTNLAYLLVLLFYKKISYYNVKYYGLRKRFLYISTYSLSFLFLFLTGIFLTDKVGYSSLESMLSFYYDNSYFILDYLYLIDNFFFNNIFVSYFWLFFLLVLNAFVFYNHRCLDRNKNAEKVNKLIVITISLILFSFLSVKTSLSDEGVKKLEKNRPNAFLMLDVHIQDNSKIESEKIKTEIESYLEEEGISDYKLRYSNVMTDILYYSDNNIIYDDKEEKLVLSYQSYDITDLKNSKILLGEEAKIIEEIMLTENLAQEVMKEFNVENQKTLIGKYLNGQKIVAIVEDTEFSKKDEEYYSYTNKNLNLENWFYPLESRTIDKKQVLDKESMSFGYEEKEKFISFIVDIYDEDFSSQSIKEKLWTDDILIYSEGTTEVLISNLLISETSSNILLYFLIIILVLVFTSSLLYITAYPMVKGGKGV